MYRELCVVTLLNIFMEPHLHLKKKKCKFVKFCVRSTHEIKLSQWPDLIRQSLHLHWKWILIDVNSFHVRKKTGRLVYHFVYVIS